MHPPHHTLSTITHLRDAASNDLVRLTELDLLALLVGDRTAATSLLQTHGTLHRLARCAPRELQRTPGLGPARAVALLAGLELGRRMLLTERERGEVIRAAQDVYHRLEPVLRHLQRESFRVILLDTRHRILRDVEVARGGLTACAIHPREVFEPAIRHDAAAVIFVHNHPSGDPTPSAEDLALTTRLALAGDALGIRAIDHVVIGDGRFVSLAEQGLMATP